MPCAENQDCKAIGAADGKVWSAVSAARRSLPTASDLKRYAKEAKSVAKEAWDVFAHTDWDDDPCFGPAPTSSPEKVAAPTGSASKVKSSGSADTRSLPTASDLKKYAKTAQSITKEGWNVFAHADWDDDPCMGPAPARSVENVRSPERKPLVPSYASL